MIRDLYGTDWLLTQAIRVSAVTDPEPLCLTNAGAEALALAEPVPAKKPERNPSDHGILAILHHKSDMLQQKISRRLPVKCVDRPR